MNQPGDPYVIQTGNHQNNPVLNRQRMTVKTLGILELVHTIFCIVAGIVELLSSKRCYDDEFYHSYCYYNSIGQGIWCSLFPLIASIIGIKVSSTPKPQQIRLLMGFSIVGAVCMTTLAICEMLFEVSALQWVIFSIAIANAILMMVSASYSCCMVCPSYNNETQTQGMVYVTYSAPAGSVPFHSYPPGAQASPQYVVVNPSQLQGMGGNTNQSYLPGPQPLPNYSQALQLEAKPQ